MKLVYNSDPFFKKGSSRGLLMIHGFTATPYEFKEFAEPYIDEDYSVSIPLLRAHGKNIKEMNRTKWYDWFEDCKTALFELRKICDEIIVIGQSMGAVLAVHLAAHYQVEGVVLMAPALFFKNKASFLLPVVSPFKRYLSKKNGPDIKNEKARFEAICYDKTPTKAAAQLIKMSKHVKMDLGEIYSPVLIFHSQNDHVIDYKSSEYIYNNISSKNKKILKLTQSYHVLTLDDDKEIIKSETHKFINQVFTKNTKQ